jgi:2-keto-4-pentenoate hydratase
MSGFHPRVIAALQAQLAARDAVLAAGASHVGWKVALGIDGAAGLVGAEPLFGYLTTATLLESGACFEPSGIRKLQVDCELAVELGSDVVAGDGAGAVEQAVAGVATALELCEIAYPSNAFDTIVAENVLHRALVLGTFVPASPQAERAGRIHVNGQLRHESVVEDVLSRIFGIARLLEAVGQGLRAGDRIICGSICSGLPVRGDEVEVQVAGLAGVGISIAGEIRRSLQRARGS